jgi:LAO/AO transport system kinase
VLNRVSQPQRKEPTVAELTKSLIAGDRAALARAMTWAESTRPEVTQRFREVLDRLPRPTSPSIRLGVSGTPGVGKSTFIEAFGQSLLGSGFRLAVLAIDPSSLASRGSILGDKTRMEKLSRDERAFVRPSPSRGFLGGTHARTFDLIELCERVGFDAIIVETVGVGQSEVAIRDLVDVVLLLLQPSSGDELQGIKRGVVEIADWILINKADGDRVAAAEATRMEYESAVSLFDRSVQVEKLSALDPKQVTAFWARVKDGLEKKRKTERWLGQRRQQVESWLQSQVSVALIEKYLHSAEGQDKIRSMALKLEVDASGTFDMTRGRREIEDFTRG